MRRLKRDNYWKKDTYMSREKQVKTLTIILWSLISYWPILLLMLLIENIKIIETPIDDKAKSVLRVTVYTHTRNGLLYYTHDIMMFVGISNKGFMLVISRLRTKFRKYFYTIVIKSFLSSCDYFYYIIDNTRMYNVSWCL